MERIEINERVNAGLIERVGANKNGYWVVTKKTRVILIFQVMILTKAAEKMFMKNCKRF